MLTNNVHLKNSSFASNSSLIWATWVSFSYFLPFGFHVSPDLFKILFSLNFKFDKLTNVIVTMWNCIIQWSTFSLIQWIQIIDVFNNYFANIQTASSSSKVKSSHTKAHIWILDFNVVKYQIRGSNRRVILVCHKISDMISDVNSSPIFY